MQNFEVLGVPISAVNLESATQAIHQWCKDKKGRYVCVRDIHGVMLSLKDSTLSGIHTKASMITPDGKPLAVIGKKKGLPVSQTTGSSLMLEVISKGVDMELKHYFYGGKEGVAEELKAVFVRKYPGINIVGTETPPFREKTELEIVATRKRIGASGADVVWVGLSTPKQEYWMMENVEHTPCTLIGVGAAFDFHTGRVKRAPVWMQTLMLEWFYRLLCEPKRLWRRYLIMVPKFVVAYSQDIISRKLGN